MGCLYQISFQNGKRYIGMTVSDPRKRLWEHRYNAQIGKEFALSNAIREYGLKDEQFKILAIGQGREYLSQLERNAIRVFETRKPGGYNMTDGGDGAPEGNLYQLGKKRTLESRRKMSVSATGRKNTPEQNAKIGAASRGNKYCLGVKHSDAVRLGMSVAQRGIKKSTSTTGFVGVSTDRKNRKFRAHLTIRGKMIDLGRFNVIEEAIAARAEGERKHFSDKCP